jgi:hypothetical protein
MESVEGIELMWDEPIAELKVGGINGISFRKGQDFGKPKPGTKDTVRIVDIRREVDSVDDEVFLIFAKKNNKGDIRLLKVSKGEPVYVTFEVFKD